MKRAGSPLTKAVPRTHRKRLRSISAVSVSGCSYGIICWEPALRDEGLGVVEVGRGQVGSEVADLNAGLKGREPIWLIECLFGGEV